MTDLTLEMLRVELAPLIAGVRQEMTAIRPHVDDVPAIVAAIETLRHEVLEARLAVLERAR
jgi:hypothetical protein